MMGFREFAKSQYDTIKLRDPALREEKEFFVSLCKSTVLASCCTRII